MGSINMRLTPQDPRFFSPDRDLAYCTPHLVHRAMQGLDPLKQEPWISSYLAMHSISNDALVDAAKCLAEYMNKTLLDPKYKHPFEALEAAGFFNLPMPVQIIVLAKLGQVFMSGFFTSIRDITRDPSEPPVDTTQIADQAALLQKDLTWYRSVPKWRLWLTKTWYRIRLYLGRI